MNGPARTGGLHTAAATHAGAHMPRRARGARARRLRAVVLAVLALAGVAAGAPPGAGGPAGVAAHGGAVVASGGNRAYTLTVHAADARTAAGEPVVDLTAYPVRRSNGATDLRARVEIELGDGRTVRPVPRGDGLEALVPVERPGEWRSWTIAARVTGEAGELRIEGAPAPGPSSGPPGWLWPASALAALTALAGVVAARRRIRAGAGG